MVQPPQSAEGEVCVRRKGKALRKYPICRFVHLLHQISLGPKEENSQKKPPSRMLVVEFEGRVLRVYVLQKTSMLYAQWLNHPCCYCALLACCVVVVVYATLLVRFGPAPEQGKKEGACRRQVHQVVVIVQEGG